MGGLPLQAAPSNIAAAEAQPKQGASSTVAVAETQPNQGLPTTTAGQESKPKKKICCACPDTKKLRDECIVQHGEDACGKWIEAHRMCLRAEGFNV